MSFDTTLTPGRIVHYWLADYHGAEPTPHAAIVTAVGAGDGRANLAVFTTDGKGTLSRPGTFHGKPGKADTWTWPQETTAA